MNYKTQIALSLVANILSQNADHKDEEIINLAVAAGIENFDWKYITLNYREMYEDIIDSGLFNNVSNGLTDTIINRENKKYADVFINFALFREFYIKYFRCGYKTSIYGEITNYFGDENKIDDDEFDIRPTPILEKKLFGRSILNKKNRQSIITFIKRLILQLIPDNENFNNKAKLLDILDGSEPTRPNIEEKIRFVEEFNELSTIQIRENKKEKIRKIRFLYGIVKNVIHVHEIEVKEHIYQNKQLIINSRNLVDISNRKTHIKNLEKHITEINKFEIPKNYYMYNNKSTFLLQVFIPDFITHIGSYSFTGHLLTELTLPNSLQTIDQSAFSNNELTSIIIPKSVKSIGPLAFSDNRLTSVIFSGNNYVQIDEEAFSYNELTHVDIPVYDENPFAFDDSVTITVKENELEELGEYGKKRKSRKNKRKSRKNKIKSRKNKRKIK